MRSYELNPDSLISQLVIRNSEFAYIVMRFAAAGKRFSRSVESTGLYMFYAAGVCLGGPIVPCLHELRRADSTLMQVYASVSRALVVGRRARGYVVR